MNRFLSKLSICFIGILLTNSQTGSPQYLTEQILGKLDSLISGFVMCLNNNCKGFVTVAISLKSKQIIESALCSEPYQTLRCNHPLVLQTCITSTPPPTPVPFLLTLYTNMKLLKLNEQLESKFESCILSEGID